MALLGSMAKPVRSRPPMVSTTMLEYSRNNNYNNNRGNFPDWMVL